MSWREGNNGSFAKIEIKEAWLSTEFGESYARRVFDDDGFVQQTGHCEVDDMPRYVRGNRKGKLKGKIVWRKVTKGGWLSGYGIVKPGTTYAHGLWVEEWGGGGRELKFGDDAYDSELATIALNEKREATRQTVKDGYFDGTDGGYAAGYAYACGYHD